MPKIRLHENCQAIHCNSVCNHKLCFSISAVRYCTVFSHPFIYSDCLMRCVRLCIHHTTERSCNGDHHIVSLTWEVRVNFVAAIFNAQNMKCLPKHWHAYGNGIYLHCRRFVCIYILWFYYNIAISIINARFLQSCHFHKQTPHTHMVLFPYVHSSHSILSCTHMWYNLHWIFICTYLHERAITFSVCINVPLRRASSCLLIIITKCSAYDLALVFNH